MHQITHKIMFVCSHIKDQRVMNVLSVLLGVDLKEAAEAQGRRSSICLCVCVDVCIQECGTMFALTSQRLQKLVMIHTLILLLFLLNRRQLKQMSRWAQPAQKRSARKKHK